MRRSLPECLPDGRTRFTRALAVPERSPSAGASRSLPDGRTRFTRALAVPERPQAPEPPGAFLTIEPASPVPCGRAGAPAMRRSLPEPQCRPFHPPALRSGFPSGNLARIDGIRLLDSVLEPKFSGWRILAHIQTLTRIWRETRGPARNGGPKARRKAARTKRPCPRARHAPFPGPGAGHRESGACAPGRGAVRAPFISAPHEPGAARD